MNASIMSEWVYNTLSIYICISAVKGLSFSLEGGARNLQKVGVDKTAIPLFRQQKFQNFFDPPSSIHLIP